MKRSKVKKLQVIEAQDAEGISRKKWSHSMSPTLFVILKIVVLVLIPIVYFVYSPLLIVLMLAYLSFFFLAILTERRMNKSVIKDNQIKLPKFDTAFALIAIVVTIVGVCLDSTSNVKSSSLGNLSSDQMMEFKLDSANSSSESFDIENFDYKSAKSSNSLQSFVSVLKNLGSMLTGERNVFSSSDSTSFSFGKFDMTDGEGRGGGKGEMMEFDSSTSSSESGFELPEIDDFKNNEQGMKQIMNDLPVDDMLSTILSSANTALIFATVVAGAFSLLIIVIKKRKFERVVNEVIVEAPVMLSDEEIDRILSFGEEADGEIDLKAIEAKIERDKGSGAEEIDEAESFDTGSLDLSKVDELGKETNFDENEQVQEPESEDESLDQSEKFSSEGEIETSEDALNKKSKKHK